MHKHLFPAICVVMLIAPQALALENLKYECKSGDSVRHIELVYEKPASQVPGPDEDALEGRIRAGFLRAAHRGLPGEAGKTRLDVPTGESGAGEERKSQGGSIRTKFLGDSCASQSFTGA